MHKPIFHSVVRLAAFMVALVFIIIVADMLWHGAAKLSWEFLISEPENSGRAGGISTILISTLAILGIALAVTIPLGLAAALWLTEYAKQNKSTQTIRLGLDVLAGIPSIVFGLFGNAFFCLFLDFGFSILSGGLTLACMILPVFIRQTEIGFSAVPSAWRASAAALGLSRLTLIVRIIIPTAAPAIAAGLVLGIGRAAAETAALLFTSGYADRMPTSAFDSGRALSVHIFDLSMNISGGDEAAYGSALVLIACVGAVNALAFFLINNFLAKRVMHVS
jgi:phosphate transport system permease protein